MDEDVKGEREGQEHTQRGTGKILPDGGAEKEEEDRVSDADTPPAVVETPAGGEEDRLRGEAEGREPRGEGEAAVRDREQGGRGGGPFFDETGAGESEVGPAGIGGADAPAEVKARAKSIEPVLGRLAQLGIERSSLLLAWDFTTASRQSLSGPALKMRNEA
ncbi:MAG: hypothetical protein NTX09_06975, partial [Verrucomicrobia bacterium]|nr:hypothetical protein [Verrucomicrobiota bacterium]